MSTLKVTNIQDTSGGNSSTSAEIYSGRAKSWVCFNGQGTVAIRDSFNVNTVTDSGTGDYDINFTTAFSDVNYACAACYQRVGTNEVVQHIYSQSTASKSAVETFSGGSQADFSYVSFVYWK